MVPANLEEETQYKEPAYGEYRHLRKLTVKTLQVDDDEYRLPISWLELLSHFQNVSELNLYLGFGYGSSNANTIEIQKAVQAINTIRNHDQSKLPLTSFNFGDLQVSNGSRQLFTLLQKLNLPFDSLHIELEPGVQSEVVKAALEPCMKNLTRFNIENSSGPSFPFGMEPQVWNNLETLWLTGDTCDNLDFLRFTPNLGGFIVTDHTIGRDAPQYRETRMVANTSQERLGDVKLLKLTCLDISFVVTDDDLRCLTRWFPNVDYCSLVMDDRLFAMVCESWKKTNFLIVHGNALTERGITGRSRVLSETDQALESEKDVPPNISSLQDLEVAMFPDLKLTEYAVTHGLIQLPKLYSLGFHHSTEIGEQVMGALEAKGVHTETYPLGR